jgi:lipid-A-disaccharide synthase-like uncharacterized protein
MFQKMSLLRFIASLAAGYFATLIVFGLALSLLWAVMPQESVWRMLSTFISSALALFAGGFVIAWLSRAHRWFLPAAFGLFFGGVSFLYLLGLEWIVLAFAAVSALAAALGAMLYLRSVRT